MTIEIGAAVSEEAGQVVAISDSGVITNTSFNAGTVTQITLADKVKSGDFVLDVTMAVAPAAGAAFNLYRRGMNIDGANHAPVPDANFKSTFIGTFFLDLVSTQQYIELDGAPIKKDQEFYIENDTGQSTSGTTVLKVTPWTYNGKA